MPLQSRISLPLNTLPPQLTPIIDRKTELAQLAQRLLTENCRLLSLVGPGGIGKTRLALQGAAALCDSFPDGAYFVPLQTIDSPDLLCTAIADALGLSLAGQVALAERLTHYLGNQHLLLVLDNVEQLLAFGGAEIIAGLLHATTQVKILVTSREVLNLQEEWLFPVSGLPYPAPALPPNADPTPTWETVQAYGAVQLFVECARRVQPAFSPAQEVANLVRICQLVQGMPLALELAASWVKTLSCAEIAGEIEHDLSFLASTLRNPPERHRSMQAVFNHTWQGLTHAEQTVFKRLSIFRGGFRRQAAERVAGASLLILSALVDKSLLRCERDGRYQIHELLRQYAAEQLAHSAADTADARAQHSLYYADFMHERAEHLMGEQQAAILDELNRELDNIRSAWVWAVAHNDAANLAKAAYTFYHFHNLQGRFREVVTALESAIAQFDAAPTTTGQQATTLALLNVLLGFCYPRLGYFAQSRRVLERSRTLFQQLKVEPPAGISMDPTLGLALLNNIEGHYAESRALAEVTRRHHEQRGNQHDLLVALYALGDVSIILGDYVAARRYSEQTYALAETLGNRWKMAVIRRDFGRIARCEGDTRQARQQLGVAYALMEANHDPEGMAVVLNHLGKTAWLEGAYSEAEQLYTRSLALYRDLDDRGGLATALSGMGDTWLALGQIKRAHACLREALSIAAAIHWARLTPEVLVSISVLFQRLGQPARSVALLMLVLQAAGATHETRRLAHQRLNECKEQLTAADFAIATQKGLASELAEILTALPAELLALEDGLMAARLEPPLLVGDLVTTHGQPPAQPLVEPLTNRELEVLHLIAAGLSNQQIANKLILSLGTVKFYACQIYGKLGVNNRVQAITQARELALLN